MPVTIQSPCLHQFVITMYCHYDQRIQQYKNNPAARRFLERTQAHYIEMHELLVSFDQVVNGLPISKIKK